MGADLMVRYASQIASAIGNLDLRYVNVVGTGLSSCVKRGSGLDAYNGERISDVYVLDFTVNGGDFVAVTAGEGAKNPYQNLTPVAITDDDATLHYDIIPGLVLKFDSVNNGDQAIVANGAYLSAAGADTPVFNFGPTIFEEDPSGVRCGAINIGDADAVQCFLKACPGFYWEVSSGERRNIVTRFMPHSDPTRDTLAPAGTTNLTFQNWTNQGAYYTADVYKGSDLIISTAKFDGATIYEHGDGHGYVDAEDGLKGLQIVFANVSEDPTSKTLSVYVREGWEWVEIAEDLNGAPGGYQASELGLIDLAVTDYTFFWYRFNLPEGTARGSLKLWTPRIRYLEV